MSSPLRSRLRRLVWIGAVLTCVCGGASEATAVDCPGLLEMHGMLRWAAKRCGFTRYNPDVVETARQCFDELGSATAAPLMWAGRRKFDRLLDIRGELAFCSEIERKFPMVVRP